MSACRCRWSTAAARFGIGASASSPIAARSGATIGGLEERGLEDVPGARERSDKPGPMWAGLTSAP